MKFHPLQQAVWRNKDTIESEYKGETDKKVFSYNPQLTVFSIRHPHNYFLYSKVLAGMVSGYLWSDAIRP